MDSEELIVRLAAEDGGVVSRQHLLRSGVAATRISDLRRLGGLTVIRRGWYALPGASPAVVATVRAGAVVACVSALVHRRGVWIPPNQHRLHVRWSEHRSRPRFERRCGARPALRTPIRAVDALGDALRCAADCLERDMLVAVLESTLRLPVPYTLADLEECFAGAAQRVTTLLPALDPLSGSGTESLVRFRLRSEHIAVRSQVVIPGVGRVDLLVGDRLIIECDSDGFHNGAQRRRDYRRDRVATVGGYLVLRVDYCEVIDQWDEILEEIRAIIRAGRHRGATAF